MNTIKYSWNYTIYEVPVPPPSLDPIVTWDVGNGGALFNQTQVPLNGLGWLPDIDFSPDGQDCYGAGYQFNTITHDNHIGAIDGQQYHLTPAAVTGRDDVRTAFAAAGWDPDLRLDEDGWTGLTFRSSPTRSTAR